MPFVVTTDDDVPSIRKRRRGDDDDDPHHHHQHHRGGGGIYRLYEPPDRHRDHYLPNPAPNQPSSSRKRALLPLGSKSKRARLAAATAAGALLPEADPPARHHSP
ncbi:hypothetical protein E4U41_005613, partial [Claviceps citrina]